MYLRLLLLLLVLARDAIAQSCSSKVYCKLPEVRYMGMKQASNVYLNVTAINSTTTTDIPTCQTQCLRENGCFSININISKVNKYGCHLLAENLYTNSTLLVKDTDFIHLFVESPCKENPCKHGGICVPSYVNDTYTCKCNNVNKTFVTRGKNCASVSSGFRSADYYWTFDEIKIDQFPAFSGTRHKVSEFKFKSMNIPVVRVPGRHSPVAYGKPVPDTTPSFFLSETLRIPCLNTFSGCETGATYSLWMKITEAEIKRAKHGFLSIFFTAFAGEYYQAQGIQFYLEKTGKMTKFHLYSATKSFILIHRFEENVNIMQWNHFAFTYSNSSEVLCGYVNGKSEQCTSVFSSISFPNTSKQFRIGYGANVGPVTEMYIDNFAVWKSALSAAEIKDVYDQSRV